MNIKQAKQEIQNTLLAYLSKDELGNYRIPTVRQRPVLLMGPPGIGKTQIMAQIAAETGVGLVAYTITHHTRQSAIGLPFISRKVYGGGGIIPDVFVPMDTTKATKFHINCTRKATAMRFASAMFDKYKDSLAQISDFETLRTYLDGLGLEKQFLDYASRVDGFVPKAGEWEQTREYFMPNVYGLVGRYSKVGEEAFYRFYLPIDDTIQAALKH